MKKTIAAVALLVATSVAASAETVKIANIGHGYFSGALYLAKREKLFEKHGLEAEVITVNGGALALQAVLTKQAEVGLFTYEHVLTAAVQGKRLVSFFNIANRPINNIIASEKLLVAGKGKSIEEKVKLLKDQRVGLPSANGAGEKMLGVLARKYGLKLPGDITAAYLGTDAPAYVAAFSRDMIDAGAPFEPAGIMVQQAGKGGIYLNFMSGEVPEFNDIINMTLAANPEVLKEKPELFRKVAAVFTEAHHILKTDPKRGKAIMAQEFPALSAQSNDLAYDTVNQIWTKDGRMTLAQAKATFDYLLPKGPHAVDFPSTFTNDFLPKK